MAEIFGLLLIATALVWATVATSGPATARVPSQRIRVESGQTLWTLAAQHPVPGMTTEQTAELIATANHIDGGQIDAGAAITIPARADQSLALACR